MDAHRGRARARPIRVEPDVNDRDGVVVHALGPDGTVRDGWPWSAGAPIGEQGKCPQGDTGCGVWRTVPALGPGEVLLVLLAPADAKSGGQVVAVGPDGRVVDGWPVKLTNPAARWDVVAAGAAGTVYATAVERCREPRRRPRCSRSRRTARWPGGRRSSANDVIDSPAKARRSTCHGTDARGSVVLTPCLPAERASWPQTAQGQFRPPATRRRQARSRSGGSRPRCM